MIYVTGRRSGGRAEQASVPLEAERAVSCGGQCRLKPGQAEPGRPKPARTEPGRVGGDWIEQSVGRGTMELLCMHVDRRL